MSVPRGLDEPQPGAHEMAVHDLDERVNRQAAKGINEQPANGDGGIACTRR
jgi:hypothetical protein